jgi:hypothetical protein
VACACACACAVANLVKALEAFSDKDLAHAVKNASVDDAVGAERRDAAGLSLETTENDVGGHGEGDDDGGLDDVIDGERQRVLDVVQRALAGLDLLHDQRRQLVAVREESHHIVEDAERDERAQAIRTNQISNND